MSDNVCCSTSLIGPLTPPQLATPANAAATATSATTIDVTWTPVDNADGYTLVYWPVGDPGAALTVTATAPPVTLTGLEPGTAYRVDITATDSTGAYADSEPALATATTLAPLAAPAYTSYQFTNTRQLRVNYTGDPDATNTDWSNTVDAVEVDSGTAAAANGFVTIGEWSPDAVNTVALTAIDTTGAHGDSSTTTQPLDLPARLAQPTVTVTEVDTTTATFTATADPAATLWRFTWSIGSTEAGTTTSATNTYTATGLTTGTEYTVTAFAVDTGTGPAASPSLDATPVPFTLEPALDAPTVVTPTASDTELVTGSTTVTDGETYTVRWAPTGTTTWQDSGPLTPSGSTAPYTITGLDPAAAYDIQVQAHATGRPDSPWSAVVTASTTLARPANLTVDPAVITAAATWDASAQADGYTYSLAPADGDNPTGDVTATTVTLTGLTGATAYTLTVTATDSTDTWADSPVSTAQFTTDTPPQLPTPTNFTAGTASPTSTAVSGGWDEITGSDGGEITYDPAAPGSSTDTGNGFFDTVGLTPATAYTITLRATDSTGANAPSEPVTTQVTTDPA